MNGKKSLPWSVLASLILALILAGFAYYVIRQADTSRANLPVLAEVPDFQFRDQNDRSFGRNQMLGKVCVVDFIFTRCQGICPVMSNRYTHLYRLFRDTPELQLISVSVDPDYDTPEILRKYAANYGIMDERWILLHAPLDHVQDLCENGFLLPAQDLPQGHSGKFALVDRQGRIRGYYDHDSDADQNLLKTHLRALLKTKL
ncbi:MAG TPA: SCO family protein [bacterium]|jgi:protein SCO1/2